MAHKIFIIDDDPAQLRITEAIVQMRLGFQTMVATSGREAIERFLLRAQPRPDLVLLDLIMPDVSGVEVIRAIRRSHPFIPILVLAPHGNPDLLVEAIRAGANDHLHKPTNLDCLKLAVHNLLQREIMRQELGRLKRYQAAHCRFNDLLGQDPLFLSALDQARRASKSTLPVLIDGESGCGKELFARTIHSENSEPNSQFTVVNCADAHDHYLHHLCRLADASQPESERRHSVDALLGQKAKGTLLLRQVDCLTPSQQHDVVRALSFMQSQHDKTGPVRIMATAMKGLDNHVRSEDFSLELYDKISACKVNVPSLKERPGDVIMLAESFLDRISVREKAQLCQLSQSAQTLLMHYGWPDNISELWSVLEKALSQFDEVELQASHIAPWLQQDFIQLYEHCGEYDVKAAASENGFSLLDGNGNVKPIEQIEAEMIQFAIQHYGGKMTEVAKRLGIGRSTLYRKLQDYNIEIAA